MPSSPLRKLWLNALERERYGYGARVADEWRDFATFAAAVGERPAGARLARIDRSRGIEPGNVEWRMPARPPVAPGLTRERVSKRISEGWCERCARNVPPKAYNIAAKLCDCGRIVVVDGRVVTGERKAPPA